MKKKPPKARKKMGRPPLGDRARTSNVTVKLSLQERRMFKAEAMKAGMPFRGWLLFPRREEFADKLKEEE